MAQDCFKLLAALLRQAEGFKPSNGQLRFLLTWAFGDMEQAAAQQGPFALLKVSPADIFMNNGQMTVNMTVYRLQLTLLLGV